MQNRVEQEYSLQFSVHDRVNLLRQTGCWYTGWYSEPNSFSTVSYFKSIECGGGEKLMWYCNFSETSRERVAQGIDVHYTKLKLQHISKMFM